MEDANWWGDDDSLIMSVAHWAVDVGELNNAHDLIAFMERPWHYPALFEEWCGSPTISINS
jgi:hypothetical protein